MGDGVEQMAMCEPERPWRVDRLTPRQKGVLEWALLHREIRTHELAMVHGYLAPSAALRVLVGRGLLRRVKRGRYAPVTPPAERPL